MKPTEDVAPWIERMARVGYTAKGMLYITIGYLAAMAGLGRGGGVTDTGGAMRQVKSASLGQPLLLVIAAGLLGYAGWRLRPLTAELPRVRSLLTLKPRGAVRMMVEAAARLEAPA
jgi:hypothetical protein